MREGAAVSDPSFAPARIAIFLATAIAAIGTIVPLIWMVSVVKE